MAIKERTFEVAGHFRFQDECSTLKVGDLVYLVPEPDNEHDENAIRAYSDNGEVIGYVPMDDNEEYLKFLGRTYTNYCARVKSLQSIGNEIQPVVEVFFAKTEEELPFPQPPKIRLHTTYESGGGVSYEVKIGNKNPNKIKLNLTAPIFLLILAVILIGFFFITLEQ
jgi:hypothetical protein